MPGPELLDALPVAAALLDRDGRILATNVQWRALGPDHPLPCRAVGAHVLDGALDVAGEAGVAMSELERVLAGVGRRVDIDYAVAVPAGRRWFRLEAQHLPGGGFVVCHSDVSRHAETVGALERDARLDPLTGLLNRRAFRSLIERRLAGTSTEPAMLGIIDLDDFKKVNDRYGHVMGDQLLERLGLRLQRAVRTSDAVGRLGGDEFMILAPGIGGEPALGDLTERLRQIVEAPVYLQRQSVRLRASMGAVILEGGFADVDAALAAADACMYRDKRVRAQLETATDLLKDVR
jgi:diguanylate cyclase (GGDEF)-like protein